MMLPPVRLRFGERNAEPAVPLLVEKAPAGFPPPPTPARGARAPFPRGFSFLGTSPRPFPSYGRHRHLLARAPRSGRTAKSRPPRDTSPLSEEVRPRQRYSTRSQSDPKPTSPLYSITSSARSRKVSGTGRPIAFAALRLITNWYLVGTCTGRSAGWHLAGFDRRRMPRVATSR
jgi:hypothetical protein